VSLTLSLSLSCQKPATDEAAVELRSSSINNRELLFLLVSRRSRHRAGTRYFSRGIDTAGNTSNFNESEQIILLDPLPHNGEPVRRGRVDGREKLSFVQTRGSVPIFWAEVNNLRYKPDLQVMDIPETVSMPPIHVGQRMLILSGQCPSEPHSSAYLVLWQRLPRQSRQSQRLRASRQRRV
jgi:hypothetical protein